MYHSVTSYYYPLERSQTLTESIWNTLESLHEDHQVPLLSQKSPEALLEWSDHGLPPTPSGKYPLVPPTAKLIIK